MERLDIDNILKLDFLNNEMEYEKAISIYGRLRWMVKEDENLKPIKEHLKELIKAYEIENWDNEEKINDEKIKESDIAEKLIVAENNFIAKRKKIIKDKLKENGLNQKDLASILGHRPNYMSELINGVRPFSRDDIIAIHRLFEIELKDLMPPFLKTETANHIKRTLKNLKNKRTKIKIRDIEIT